MEKMLNLGCGQFPKPGYINLDLDPNSKADLIHDLRQFPYPFEDESFSRIEASHLLEHLSDPFLVMKEIHRIVKPGGIVDIRVPHFSRGMTHAEHKSGFDLEKLPTGNFNANKAYFLIGQLAYNLVAWLKSFFLPQAFARATIKTIRHKFLFVAAKVIRRSKQVFIKLSKNYLRKQQFLETLYALARV